MEPIYGGDYFYLREDGALFLCKTLDSKEYNKKFPSASAFSKAVTMGGCMASIRSLSAAIVNAGYDYKQLKKINEDDVGFVYSEELPYTNKEELNKYLNGLNEAIYWVREILKTENYNEKIQETGTKLIQEYQEEINRIKRLLKE